MKRLILITFFNLLFLVGYGQIIYVDADAVGSNNGTSWANAYTSLQSALPLATTANQIWVVEGTYKPHATDRTVSFNILTGTKLYGGFNGTETLLSQSNPTTNVTKLSGDLAGNDNSTLLHTEPTRQDNTYQIVAIKGNNMSGIVIAGFTITGGNANGTISTAGGANVQYNRERGAAIATQSFSVGTTISASIQKCIFEKNTATGVAAYSHFYPSGITNVFCYVDFAACIFRNNYSLNNATVLYSGGGFYQQYNRGNQINCLFYNNTSVNAASAIQCLNSTYDPYNNANVWAAARINVVNSTFTENTGLNSKVIKVTLGDNIATFVRNSIVYNNGSTSPFEFDGFGGGVGTQNTITTNPLFIDAPNDNFRLSCSSIARDAGNNTYISPYTTDLDGLTRINNTTIDQGCYEFINAAALTAIAHNITVELDASGNATITPAQIDNGSLTSCGGLPFTLSLDVSTFNCSDLGANTVTLTANDGVTTSTATAIVTVLPYADAQNITVQLDASGNATITAAQLSNGAGACPGMIMTISNSSFTCANMGTNAVLLTVNDGNGNISTDYGIVTIEDNVPPIVVTQNISVTINPLTGVAVITPAMINNGSTDNCSITLSLSQTEFFCQDQGPNTVTLIATDGEGNQSTGTAIVTVTSPLLNFTSVATNPTLCAINTGTSITTSGSTSGVSYLLMDAADNVIAGPIAGTGSGLSFNTGSIPSTTNYNVVAQTVYSSNNALNLDGVNDYVTAGTSNRNITNAITVSARVKTYVTGGSQFIVDKYLGAGIGYYLLIDATGKATFQGRDVAGAIKTSGLSTTNVADNQWHEITGVVRNTGWEIWVDGVLENSGAYSLGGTGLGTTAALLMGAFGTTYTPVDIDKVAIWNAALSPTTILNNYTTCLEGNEANLVALFKFNETAGTIATDASSLAINGTLTNMTAPACWISGGVDACAVYCSTDMTPAVTVTVNPAVPQPTISASGSTTLCSGGSVTLTASTGTTYLWSTGATTPSITVSAAGTYTVQVANAAGCQSVASTGTTVIVGTPPAQPTVTAGGPTTFCAGGSVTLTSSTGTSYLWSNGATTQTISATNAGTYTVQVTNASGCQSLASSGTTITVNALPSQPTISAGGSTTFCAGGSVNLTASTGTSYLWSNGATTASISPTTAGTYTVQVSNAAGCQSVASAGTTITVNALPSQPTIAAGGSTTFCTGGSVTLTASAGTTYLWSTGATTASISPTTAGTYSVQVTNAAGCQSIASAGTVVTVNALPSQPTISAGGSTTFCAGGSVNLTASTGTSYLWSNGATTQSISPTTAGTYTVQVTNAAGCQSIVSVGTTVIVNALPAQPTITAGGPTTFCQGGSVTLSSSAGSSYLWSDGSMSASINPSSSGTYTVQVTNAAGCQSIASASTVLTVNPLPNAPIISPNGPITFCSGGTVNLASSAGISYLWSNGSTNFSIDVTSSGTFTAQITDPNGCQSPSSTPMTVTVNPTPTIALGTIADPTSCTVDNGSIQVNGSGTGTLSWSGTTSGTLTGVTLPTTIPNLGDGSYIITFTNATSCVSNTLNSSLSAPSAPAAPTINANTSTTFCDGGSVTLTASAGTTYLWSNGATTNSIVVTDPGAYSVSITDASGCSSPSSSATTVVVNALPIIAAGVLTNPQSCLVADGSIEITGSGQGDLTWNGPSSGSQLVVTLPAVEANLAQGNYTFEFTDANGCTSDPLAVNLTAPGAPAAPTISTNGPTTFCEGGMVTLTASAGDTYLWSNGETTASIDVLANGTFTVSITDASGCVSPSSNTTIVVVDQMPDLNVTMTNNVLTAVQTSANYQWIDCATGLVIAGETNQVFTPTQNGNYAVVISSGTCSDTSACSLVSTIGMDEIDSKLTIRIQPNPTNNEVEIISEMAIDRIEIYTLNGAIVQTEYAKAFSVGQLSTGVYLVKVYSTDGMVIERLVKN